MEKLDSQFKKLFQNKELFKDDQVKLNQEVAKIMKQIDQRNQEGDKSWCDEVISFCFWYIHSKVQTSYMCQELLDFAMHSKLKDIK